jgi:undecaprenyl-phosphate 4-deoxy-4-formamido-L-arabinose transferase
MPITDNRKISFVIACYNSENTLRAVVQEIVNLLESGKIDYEVILVNDGSSDKTMKVINSLCDSSSKIVGIELSKNFGQHNAMMAGFRFACGDLIFYSDDDGQCPVDEYQRFIKKIDEGYDMVFAKYSSQKRSFLNSIGAKVNNRMLKFILNKPLDLNFGNFWVSKRYVIDEALKCTNPRVHLGGLFLTITSSMANVSCEKRNRLSGDSNYSFLKLVMIWLNALTFFSIAPLRIASITGGIVAMLGMIYMIYLIIFKLIYGNLLIGYSSIMSVILFTGGMLMMMIGIVGEYIGRLSSNLNSLPQSVVKQTINVKNDK